MSVGTLYTSWNIHEISNYFTFPITQYVWMTIKPFTFTLKYDIVASLGLMIFFSIFNRNIHYLNL